MADETEILGEEARGRYVNYVHGKDSVTLDSAFTIDELKKIIAYMESHK